MNCRFCNNKLSHELVDLGFSPPSNSYLNSHQLNEPEVFFPLRIMVCDSCFLVQIDEFKDHSEIFNSEYAYFSSYSKSWLKHAENFAKVMEAKLGLDENSKVIEIASNDGYLLQYFLKKGISVLGIEPTGNTAQVAMNKGIDCIVDFFSHNLASELATRMIKADLLVGNNVLAHVPNINDFVSGLKILLKHDGVITMEFPHLLNLLGKNQFDTIYHEHFSYLSFTTVSKIFESHGLEIFDVEEIFTHGGSLRIYAKHKEFVGFTVEERVHKMLEKEKANGLLQLKTFSSFQEKVDLIKNSLLQFLIDAKKNSQKVVAYGAAAKGVTLLNFCGIKKDLISFVVDASPHKQNKFIPGVHIPIVNEVEIKKLKPDYVIILPWNLKNEISDQLQYIDSWGGQFVVAIPRIQVF
ncbi:class I SAM-dependent methyltransferase [Jiulongibacter sediminis]|uniref:class I SAM-dependent methyltransferase n=1 Tax=Jiulongibacter sediminis TaxID=1605367 RepID=UPI0026EF69AC|nr:class I SAM-dependent methyltransferase [Jiulongibacter sediminis]